MKKLFALLLCLGVMLSCAVCVSADNVTTVEIISPVEEVTPGEEITFEVYLSATEACSSFGIALKYDQTVFEIVGGECEMGGATLNVFDPGKGFAYLFEDAKVLDGLVGTFVMKVKESAPAGSAQIEATISVKNASKTLPSVVIPAQLNIVTGATEQNPEELMPAETVPATENVAVNENTQTTEPANVVQEEVAPAETVPEQTTATETATTKPEAETQPKQTEAPAVQPAPTQKPAEDKPVPTELIIAVAVLVVLVGALLFCCVKLFKNKKAKK